MDFFFYKRWSPWAQPKLESQDGIAETAYPKDSPLAWNFPDLESVSVYYPATTYPNGEELPWGKLAANQAHLYKIDKYHFQVGGDRVMTQ